jgi:pimeloyl-ACP methyl ester carboxylesterase
MSTESPIRENNIEFRSPDGLLLRGTIVISSDISASPTVLVHGGGVTRDEGGFFTRLSSGLADVGISSLRFEFRGHGKSEGRQEDLTISGVLNDIRSAIQYVFSQTSSQQANLIGASFGGGISALYAATYPQQIQRLTLINPLLNYKKRFIDDKPYWRGDHIDSEAGAELSENGYIPHSPTFKLGRALLNEVFYVQPHTALSSVAASTLIVHGTKDTFVPIESSRNAIREFQVPARLLEIEGAQHGIAVHDDPEYKNPQTREWQTFAVRSIAEWLSADR